MINYNIFLIYFINLIRIHVILAVSIKKTVVVTGASSGVGLATTKILASTNKWNIIMACRNLEKAEMVKQSITESNNVKIMQLDLADLNSVSQFAKRFQNQPIDCLVCNAGVQESINGLGGKEANAIVYRTKQDFEITVGTNHIGHFLLLKLLLKNVKASNSGRIVLVGSGVHDPESGGGKVGSKATLGDLKGFKDGFKTPIAMVDGGDYDPDKAYKDSKLCNVMTSLELARRLLNEKSFVTCNVMNPGLIPTSGLFRAINPIFVFVFTILTRYVFRVAVSEEEGGRRLAYMIDSPVIRNVTGGYFSDVPGPGGKTFGILTPSKEAQDQKKAKLLWDLTDQLVASYI